MHIDKQRAEFLQVRILLPKLILCAQKALHLGTGVFKLLFLFPHGCETCGQVLQLRVLLLQYVPSPDALLLPFCKVFAQLLASAVVREYCLQGGGFLLQRFNFTLHFFGLLQPSLCGGEFRLLFLKCLPGAFQPRKGFSSAVRQAEAHIDGSKPSFQSFQEFVRLCQLRFVTADEFMQQEHGLFSGEFPFPRLFCPPELRREFRAADPA